MCLVRLLLAGWGTGGVVGCPAVGRPPTTASPDPVTCTCKPNPRVRAAKAVDDYRPPVYTSKVHGLNVVGINFWHGVAFSSTAEVSRPNVTIAGLT